MTKQEIASQMYYSVAGCGEVNRSQVWTDHKCDSNTRELAGNCCYIQLMPCTTYGLILYCIDSLIEAYTTTVSSISDHIIDYIINLYIYT